MAAASQAVPPTRDLSDKRVLEIGCGRDCPLVSKSRPALRVMAADLTATALPERPYFAASQGLANLGWEKGHSNRRLYPTASFSQAQQRLGSSSRRLVRLLCTRKRWRDCGDA